MKVKPTDVDPTYWVGRELWEVYIDRTYRDSDDKLVDCDVSYVDHAPVVAVMFCGDDRKWWLVLDEYEGASYRVDRIATGDALDTITTDEQNVYLFADEDDLNALLSIMSDEKKNAIDWLENDKSDEPADIKCGVTVFGVRGIKND